MSEVVYRIMYCTGWKCRHIKVNSVESCGGMLGFGIQSTFPTCAVHDLVYYYHVSTRLMTEWDLIGHEHFKAL